MSLINMLSPETIKELSDILHDDLGKEYTSAEIFEIAHGLESLFDRLMEFDFEDNHEDENERLHQAVPEGNRAREAA